MTMILKQTLATFLAICFTFIFSTSVGAISIGEDTYSDQPENYLEYDYISKTYRTIPIDSIPDYASMTTTTYELDSMAAELPRLTAMNNSTVSPAAIVHDTINFTHTPPTSDPYSGVLLLITWADYDNDNIMDSNELRRGSGFLAAPDVVVTAAHNIIIYQDGEYVDVEVKIYPYYDSDFIPSASDDFVYPKSWICYDYMSAIESTDGDAYELMALRYDWCVIKLQEKISGAYNFACSTDLANAGTTHFIVSGYTPCTDLNCRMSATCTHTPRFRQYTSGGYITNTSDHMVYFTNNMKAGASGSPLYKAYTNICYAIVTCESYNLSANEYINGGTIINDNIYNAISYFIEQQ